MLTSQVSKLGRSGVRFISAIGRATIMLFHALAGKPAPRKHFPLLVQQLYVVGVQSVAIILVSGLFIGMVLGMQGYETLQRYGSSVVPVTFGNP